MEMERGKGWVKSVKRGREGQMGRGKGYGRG